MSKLGSKGRPRDAEADRRILAAARAALSERGYAQLSMEAVARAAGVAKQTLYRRWPRRPLLVYEAWFGGVESTVEQAPDTGTLAGDVAAVTALQAAVFGAPGSVDINAGLVADCLAEPELLEQLRAVLMRPQLTLLAEVFERARGRGELPADADCEALAEIVAGAAFSHHVLYGTDLPAFEQTLNALVTGYATAH